MAPGSVCFYIRHVSIGKKRHLSPEEYVERAGSSGQWAGVVENKAREGVKCLRGGLG